MKKETVFSKINRHNSSIESIEDQNFVLSLLKAQRQIDTNDRGEDYEDGDGGRNGKKETVEESGEQKKKKTITIFFQNFFLTAKRTKKSKFFNKTKKKLQQPNFEFIFPSILHSLLFFFHVSFRSFSFILPSFPSPSCSFLFLFFT